MAAPNPASDTPPPKQSHFEDNARLLDHSPIKIDAKYTKELVASFLTIRQFRDLLYAPDTNLVDGIKKTYIEDTMIEDFGRVIIQLRDYTGEERKGVVEAKGLMDEALKDLYTVYASLLDTDKKNTVENINIQVIRVGALVLCRDHLQKAYDQLEHLAGYIPKPPPDPNEKTMVE